MSSFAMDINVLIKCVKSSFNVSSLSALQEIRQSLKADILCPRHLVFLGIRQSIVSFRQYSLLLPHHLTTIIHSLIKFDCNV